MQLSVRRETDRDLTIIVVSGDMNAKGSHDALGATVRDLVERGSRRFILDLSRVPSVDSSSIGEVAVAVKHVVVNGGAVKAVLSRRVEQAIKPVRDWLLFDTCPDVDSCIAEFDA